MLVKGATGYNLNDDDILEYLYFENDVSSHKDIPVSSEVPFLMMTTHIASGINYINLV